MSLFFLIPLTISLGTSYIFKNSDTDLAELMSLATVFNLILSLALAPWQFQLVVLMLVLIGSKQVLPSRNYRTEENNDLRMF